MLAATYTRKQMGVVYRAVKEGKLELDKGQIARLYDMADGMQAWNTDDGRLADALRYGMRNAIDSILAGEYGSAMASIENMLAA